MKPFKLNHAFEPVVMLCGHRVSQELPTDPDENRRARVYLEGQKCNGCKDAEVIKARRQGKAKAAA